MLKSNISERWVFTLKKALLTIEPTLHCSIGNDIVFLVRRGEERMCFCPEIGLLFRFLGVLSMHTCVCK